MRHNNPSKKQIVTQYCTKYYNISSQKNEKKKF